MACDCLGMELENIDPNITSSGQNVRISAQSSLTTLNEPRVRATEVSSSYMPRHLSVTNLLRTEATCCFCTARWFLQPLNVITPIVTSALLAASEFFIKSDPKKAQLLNLIGLGFSVADFMTGVLLVKVNNKLEEIDNHIAERQNDLNSQV